jgi:hypothetical protein
MAKQRNKICDYKVVIWTDAETKVRIYGIAVLLVDGRWAYVETKRKLVIRYQRSQAEKYIADMKSKRTRAGYLRECK